jgi:hypothetical protein
MRPALRSHLLILTLWAAPAVTHAQPVEIGESPVLFGVACDRHRTHGYMGGQLMGIGAVAQSALKEDRYLSRFGGGIGLFGGVRLGPTVAIEGNWTFALHDEALGDIEGVDAQSLYIMTVTADLKLYLPTDNPLEPYLQLGGGLLMSGGIHLDDRQSGQPDSFATGATAEAGLGLDVWVTRHLAMGARVLYRALALGEPEGYERGRRFRNVVHGISVDAFATIHF